MKYQNIVKNASKVRRLGGLLGRVTAPIAGAWTIADPKTSWNQKVLGAGLFHPLTALPSALGLLVTDLAPKVIDSYYDSKVGNLYQPGDLIDPYNPDLKISPEEKEKILAYNQALIDKTNQDIQDTLDEGYYQINTPFGSNREIPDFNISTQVPQFTSPGINRSSTQNVQNAQQGPLNIPQDTQVGNLIKPTLTGNVEAPDIFNEIPDYNSWNTGVSTKIQDLQDIVNQSNQQQGEQPRQNSAGSEALLQYLQMQNAKNAQVQQQSADILKQYQDAVRADQRQNQANQLANILTSLQPAQRAPISFVTKDGQVAQIPVDQYSQANVQLPTKVSSNVDRLAGQLKLQQSLQGKQTDPTAQVLTAQALGDMYGVNPLVFLNADLAKEYMSGQNTLANTRVTGQERRQDIPYTTQAKVIEQDTKTAGQLATDKANAYYDYILENLKQGGMNSRQAEQIASQEAQNVYNQQMQNYRQANELLLRDIISQRSNLTQRDIANIYANRAQGGDQELADMYKRAQIFQISSGLQNPQQQQQYWDYIGNQSFNPISQFGTTVDQQEILRRARGNR